MTYTKECPKCNQIIRFTNKYNLRYSIKNNSFCRECRKKKDEECTKNCPKCGIIMKYKRKSNFDRSVKLNKICRDCRRKETKLKNASKVYTKKCPKCGGIMSYKMRYGLKKSIKNNIICKDCRKKKSEKKRKKYQEEYRKEHDKKPEAIKRKKEYRKEYDKRPSVIEQKKEYRKEYLKRPDVILRTRECYRMRMKDPKKKISKTISGGVRRSLKSNNLSKNGRHWEDLVGYTIQDLKDHIESLFTKGMTWEKIVKGEIQIDHIIPQKFFKYNSTDDVEFLYCWSLNNLQPLWEKDNKEKNDKMILWGKKVNARDI